MSARYGTDEYTSAIQSLFPVGRVWPRASDSVMTTLIRALAAAYRQNDADAVQLLVDAFPKTASALLPEWEATLGLPDDCACNASSDEALRRQVVVSKLIGTGGQSAAYFISLAEAMGYGISIKQYRQARAGLSVCGDAINGDRWPYVWEVTITDADNDATCALKLLLCRLEEFSPAHTKLMSLYDLTALYAINMSLLFSNGAITGTLIASACIDVADMDVTLIYTLEDGNTHTDYLVTDENGNFSTTPSVSGNYTAVARAQLFTPMCQWENVESDTISNNITMSISYASGTVSGALVASEGITVSGLPVTLTYTTQSGTTTKTVTTDSNGAFTDALTAEGDYTASASALAVNELGQQVTVISNTLEFTYEIDYAESMTLSFNGSTATVSGVLSANGVSVSGVTVTITYTSE